PLDTILGHQGTCRTALSLPGYGDTLLAQPRAKIGLVLAALNLTSSCAQLVVGQNPFRPTSERLELEYALPHRAYYSNKCYRKLSTLSHRLACLLKPSRLGGSQIGVAMCAAFEGLDVLESIGGLPDSHLATVLRDSPVMPAISRSRSPWRPLSRRIKPIWSKLMPEDDTWSFEATRSPTARRLSPLRRIPSWGLACSNSYKRCWMPRRGTWTNSSGPRMP
ncbi:MAG: hypothetical protein RIR43_1899, partial [Pseudomonadota bacterium]